MKKSYTIKNLKIDAGITLVSLVVTIVILLILSGITIATLGGENGLFARVKQAKKAHVQSEMQEQLTLALNELQVDKKGNASLDDVTQDWINTVIPSDYSPTIKEDASLDGKMVVMNKNDITGRFIVNQKLEISKTEFDISTLEFEYETEKIENGKVKILIKITDKVNGLKRVDYPEASKDSIIMENKKIPLGIDYYVELGKEYKFVITTGDGNKTEKTIKIDDYYYNVKKTLAENAVIDNNTTKAAYNKTYEATVSTEGNYAITGLTITMGGQAVTTSGNNVVDVNTGKIKIEKVTGDINITVTTKKLEIQYTVAVSTSSSSSNTSSLDANTQTIGTTLYINIIAKLEGNKCTVVLKADNSKTVPYAITANGKYTFIVRGTYSGKTIEEEKEVIVNQYIIQGSFVQYDAGEWTEEEINELKSKNLYNINKAKTASNASGLNFTFGGFTYKGDASNASDISNGNVITSRNQSVAPEKGYGTPKYSGWQILESKEVNGKTYVTKIIHAGSPENFVYYYTTQNDAYRAEYLLSSGEKQTEYNKFNTGETIKPRNYDMYKDEKMEANGYINKVHIMTKNEFTNRNIKKTEGYYWLENAQNHWYMYLVMSNGELWFRNLMGSDRHSFGIRPVIEMNEGVYIVSGSGTATDPYILDKD